MKLWSSARSNLKLRIKNLLILSRGCREEILRVTVIKKAQEAFPAKKHIGNFVVFAGQEIR